MRIRIQLKQICKENYLMKSFLELKKQKRWLKSEEKKHGADSNLRNFF